MIQDSGAHLKRNESLKPTDTVIVGSKQVKQQYTPMVQ